MGQGKDKVVAEEGGERHWRWRTGDEARGGGREVRDELGCC